MENVSIREREEEREKKEKEGEGEGELSLFYSHFLLCRPRYASFLSVFEGTVMTWQHSSSALLSHTHSFSISLYFFNSPALSPSLFMLSDILFQMVSASFIDGLCVY